MAKKGLEISREIEIPNEVSATYNDNVLIIKGPKGETARNIKAIIKNSIVNNRLLTGP